MVSQKSGEESVSRRKDWWIVSNTADRSKHCMYQCRSHGYLDRESFGNVLEMTILLSRVQ